MFNKIKEILRNLKAIHEIKVILQELAVVLKELSAKHTTDAEFRKNYLEEINRIEQSLKFEMMDFRQMKDQLATFIPEARQSLDRLNSKLDEVERKVTNLDYGR